MKLYPLGSQVVAPFGFVLRPLSVLEQRALEAGNGLPSGVGVDPDVVIFDYDKPGEPGKHIEGASVVKDAVGLYHVVLPATVKGSWNGRGRGTTTGGAPFSATPRTAWEIVD